MDFGMRLKELRTQKKMTQLQMAKILDTSKSNISKYEAGSVEPNLETLAKISRYFDVPVDYLLRIGVFENWDALLKNKTAIIHQISKQAQQLSLNIQDGLDDISFAKLVYAFDVHIEVHEDGTVGLSAKDPIPTYTNDYFSNTLPVSEEEKALLSLLRAANPNEKNEMIDLLSSFCSLSKKEKTIILGKCFELEHEESVAAEENPLKKASGK